MDKLNVSDYDYFLPEEQIAQDPLADRSSSKLLVLDKNTGETSHHVFKEIIDYLNPGDCLCINNTKGGSQKALNMLFAIRTIQERTGRDLGATFLSGYDRKPVTCRRRARKRGFRCRFSHPA